MLWRILETMPRAVFALLSLVALSASVAGTHMYAQADDDQATTINIVGPPFQSPLRVSPVDDRHAHRELVIISAAGTHDSAGARPISVARLD